LRVILLRFGVTRQVCDDGWSVVYGGTTWTQRTVLVGTTGNAQWRSGMVTGGDHGELEHVNRDKCDELV